VGAGPLPLGPPGRDEHRRRPPIPIVPVDRAAAAAVAGRGLATAAVWLAAVSGESAALRVRTVLGDAAAAALPIPARDAAAEPALTIGETALAVDHGRTLAARAAAEGITVLVGTTQGEAHSTAGAGAPARLAAALIGTGPPGGVEPAVAAALELHGPHLGGPLAALRRLGDAATAVLCGAALGAGEHGLGFACEGPAAIAAAAVAAAIEPDLRARLLAVGPPPGPAQAALLARLGVDHVAELPASDRRQAARTSIRPSRTRTA
jgi:NaMN:DMB phosphoribosyltransferase